MSGANATRSMRPGMICCPLTEVAMISFLCFIGSPLESSNPILFVEKGTIDRDDR